MNTYRYLILILIIGSFWGCSRSTPPSGQPASGASPASSSATSTATSTTPSGCYNAYYPATATLKKTYKATYSDKNFPPSSYSESFANFSGDGFTHKMEFAPYQMKDSKGKDTAPTAPVVVEGSIKCKPDGLMAMEAGNLNAGQNMQYKFKTVKAEGVSFPAESEWKVGKKWELSYEVAGEFLKTPAAGMQAPKGTIVMTSEIVGQESVTVPAGTFAAFKVAMTLNNKMMTSLAGKEMPMNTTVKSTVWFAKDVGMVKAVADVGGSTTELSAISK